MEKKEIAVGGQAVIEGVMMRGPEYIATAIRRKDNRIEIKREPFASVTKKNKFFGLPIVRGFVSLIEMLIIGYKSITFSAERWEEDFTAEEIAAGKEVKVKSKGQKQLEEIASFGFAIVLALGLFFFLPYKISDWVKAGDNNFLFNILAGVIRIAFFLLYIWLISLLGDIRRLFEYHGAEHKNVHAYEKNDTLEIPRIQAYTTLHPSCGTSFIFFVLIVSILLFSIIDSIVAWQIGGKIPLAARLAYHLLLIPLISGVSYEILKFSGKRIDHPLVKLMTVPGMAIQRITTRPPDDAQVEVALVAMCAALEMDLSGFPNAEFIEEQKS